MARGGPAAAFPWLAGERRLPLAKGVAMLQGSSAKTGQGRLRQVIRALGQFFYGMTVYEMARDLERERARAEQRFTMLVLGSLVGLPVPASYYGLRLVPLVLPSLRALQRSLWRERDLTDLCDQDLT